MNDIKKHCEDNLGGIFTLKFIDSKKVQSIAEPINSKVCEPVVLITLAVWHDCYATEGTIKFNEDLQESKHGDYYKAKLTLFTPKDRTDVTEQLELMKNETFIIDYTDNNGHRKLIGTIANPLKYSSSLDTGNSVPNRNGHTIEFSGDILKKSPTYYI